MSQEFSYAALLRDWLPAVWRERDDSGALGNLLEVYGELLDAMQNTVTQRLYDSFPDQDDQGRQCQEWLLPYFAQLLDVRLMSPDAAGRRAELASAVSWRQRKGTRVAVEQVAEGVGQFAVEIQEGWKRVAITPRVDRPLLPDAAYGGPLIADDAVPAQRARHPGLPAVTLDLRYCSRAVQDDGGGAVASTDPWYQVNRHSLSCAPDSYQDVSRRTVDVRTPNRRYGRYHPRRVLLYRAPPEGFFASDQQSISWSTLAARVDEAATTDMTDWGLNETVACTIGQVELTVSRGQWNGGVLPQIALRGLTAAPLRIRGVIRLDQPALYRFENLWFDNRVTIAAGAAQLVQCAARQLQLFTAERFAPVIDARGCLLKKVEAARGLVRLQYVTVLDTLLAERLEASDCILVPPLRKDTVDDDVPAAGCIRFSRLFHIPPPPDPQHPELINDPLWVAQWQRSALRCYGATCTVEPPLFWSSSFGSPGCGVLHPDCAAALQSGAEDGGELGACHEFRYVLRQRAVLEKLQEFLPVGMEAVLVMDPTLSCPRPTSEV